MKIVWLIISAMRVDHLGAYGNRWLETPNLDRLARNGRLFTAARCNSPTDLATRIQWLTGLDRRRFTDPLKFIQNYQTAWTLPGQFSKKGWRNALFTDHFSLRDFYEPMNIFDTMCFIPGQASDRHIPAGNGPDNLHETFHYDTLKPQTPPTVSHAESDRYFRNRQYYPNFGHPSARLFESAAAFINGLRPDENCFVLIDAYGLNPPWNPPREFARYRSPQELDRLAWPIPGPIDPDDATARKNLNFLRRAYADSCLFMDHLLTEFFNTVENKTKDDNISLMVMSDHGVLIGDENYLIGPSTGTCPALTRQVMIAHDGRIDPSGKIDQTLAPADLFGSTLAAAGIDDPPMCDGKIIKDLM